MKALRIFVLGFVLFLTAGLSAQPTEILILGTPHLNQIKGFEPEMLSSLHAKLDAMDFDAVCIEVMSTELLHDIQSREDEAFDGVLESFGGHQLEVGADFQQRMGLTFSEASARIADILEGEVEPPGGEEELPALFLAVGDIPSALLNMPPGGAEHEIPYLDAETKQWLMGKAGYSNEIYSLALPVAESEGIQRIHPIDNFQDEALLFKHFPEFISDYMANQERFADVPNAPVFQKVDSLTHESISSRDMYPLYAFFGSDEFKTSDKAAQWDIWLESNFPSGSDRARHALWEMRNLQIAANIMLTAAFYPGERMLVIIGASHTSFLEKYLEQVPDLKLLSLEDAQVSGELGNR